MTPSDQTFSRCDEDLSLGWVWAPEQIRTYARAMRHLAKSNPSKTGDGDGRRLESKGPHAHETRFGGRCAWRLVPRIALLPTTVPRRFVSHYSGTFDIVF
jgi:hypothetical protein